MTSPATPPAEIRLSTRRYLTGFAAMAALTLVAVAVAARIGDGGTRAAVTLGIAALEAALALTLFMRVTAEPWIVRGSLLLTALFLAVALTVPFWTERDHITGTHDRMWDAGVTAPAHTGAGGH